MKHKKSSVVHISNHTYKIFLFKEPDGRYTASVPSLPGCITFGENVEHAIEMAKKAIKLYIEELPQFLK